MRLLFTLAIVALGSVCSCRADDAADSPHVAHYDGPITTAANQRLFAQLAAGTVERLVIRSSGGSVEAGIALGREVHARAMDVEVRDYCLSSCANYVFTAGRTKIIPSGAVVAWHGNYRHLQVTGLWRDDIAFRMRELGEDQAIAKRRAHAHMLHLVELERAFFDHIGVDEYLCWVGKLPPYDAPDYFALSVADMARFGVRDVQASPDYALTDLGDLDHDVVFLALGAATDGHP